MVCMTQKPLLTQAVPSLAPFYGPSNLSHSSVYSATSSLPDLSRLMEVWDEGMVLFSLCYEATELFPAEDVKTLVTKIRLSASRVAASVAEGYEQLQCEGFSRCIHSAQEALLELKTYLHCSVRLSLLTQPAIHRLLAQCEVMAKQLQELQATA